MKTLIYPKKKIDNKTIINKASKFLKDGKVIVSPTDTIYGILGNYKNIETIERIYKIKNRPLEKGMIVLVSSIEKLKSLTNEKIDEKILKLLPAPLTLIIKSKENENLFGMETIAVRYPDNYFINELVKKAGDFIIATSANISGEKNIIHEKEIINNFENKVDLIILNGDLEIKNPSTILNISSKPYKILRQGLYKINRKILENL